MANNQLKEELILSTSQFDKNINSVIKKVEELKSKGSNVGNGFNASMGKMMGSATKLAGALGLITSGVQLAEWFQDSVREGVRLAQEAEGIRLAFERLNRGDLLEQLRKETHNTVTDLELMKQAVKFNDFNLSLDQMGTFLAFAQQKAKDTGESIDYMVNSIVTGLGRQSLPILDNLGISATEIKNRMKEGGDMTTAVAQIIKEKMKAAGDYVETASDRAKKQEVELQNALEDLGRTFQPLTESSDNFFHSIKIKAIEAVKWVGELTQSFTELGRVQGNYKNFGGSDKVQRMLGNLGDGKGSKLKVYTKQIAEFDRHIKKYQDRIANNPYNQAAKEQLAAVKQMKSEYERGAKNILNTKTKPTSNTSSTTSSKSGKSKVNYAEGSVGYYEELISELQNKIKLQVDSSEIKNLQDEIKEAQIKLDNLLNPRRELKIDTSNLRSLKKNKDNKNLQSEAKQLNLQTPTIFEQYNGLTNKIDSVLNDYDIGAIGAEKAQELIDSINSQIATLGLKPINIHVETDAEKELNKVGSAIGNLGDAFSSLGSALEIPAIDVAGTIAGAIASVIEGYGKASSQAASLGPWAWIAFSIAGLAQVAAIVSQIHSLSAYANGGVVGGSNYAGDTLLARVNSGEMILNGSQQKNLFDMIDKGGNGGINGGNVNFVIRGKDLHGVLSNYDDKMKKVR